MPSASHASIELLTLNLSLSEGFSIIEPHYSKEWQWYVLATNNLWCKPLYCKQNKAKYKQNKQKP